MFIPAENFIQSLSYKLDVKLRTRLESLLWIKGSRYSIKIVSTEFLYLCSRSTIIISCLFARTLDTRRLLNMWSVYKLVTSKYTLTARCIVTINSKQKICPNFLHREFLYLTDKVTVPGAVVQTCPPPYTLLYNLYMYAC